MDEGAARRLGDADAFKLVRLGMRSHARTQNIRLVQQHLHALAGVKDLDEPRVMIEERGGAILAIRGQEFFSLTVRFRCAAALTYQEPGQWPDAIHPFLF